MRDKRDTYTSDGGGYARHYGKAMSTAKSKKLSKPEEGELFSKVNRKADYGKYEWDPTQGYPSRLQAETGYNRFLNPQQIAMREDKRVRKLSPAYQTERSLASEPQSNQIGNRRRPAVTQNYQPTAPQIDSKRIRTYWQSTDGSSGVKRTPTRKKGRLAEE